MDWTKIEEKQPAAGLRVLTWGAGAADYVITSVDEKGKWEGLTAAPTHWMPLPEPPVGNSSAARSTEIKGDIIDNRMSLTMDEQRETIAALMQYYISGHMVRINGIEYYVVDMENEIDDSHVVTTFYFRQAAE